MEQQIKNVLMVICIIIALIVITRTLHIYYNLDTNNKKVEPFQNEISQDLLSKLKSERVYTSISNNNNNTTTVNPEQQISSWNNKLYNFQKTTLQQIKPIALYKPQVSIDGEQYAKLGDMISQNINYEPPGANDFTLLIKKTGSDIKPPVGYEQIIDAGNKDMNPDYYKYLDFVSGANINNVKDALGNISNYLDTSITLDKLVSTNKDIITKTFKNYIMNTATVSVKKNDNKYLFTINELLIKIQKSTNNIFDTGETRNTNNIFVLPAGIIADLDGKYNGNWTTFDVSVPSYLDKLETKGPKEILEALPYTYRNLTEKNIKFMDFEIKLFATLPAKQFIDYLLNLSTNIKIIIKKIGNTKKNLEYFNLPDLNTINSVLSILNDIKKNTKEYSNQPIYDIVKENKTTPLQYISSNLLKFKNDKTVFGNILTFIDETKITYKMTYLEFQPNNNLGLYDKNKMKFKGFDNDLAIPDSTFNIASTLNNRKYTNINFESLNDFVSDFSENKIQMLPLQIYKPVAPSGYISLGHVFTNLPSDLEKIKAANSVACIPENCVKEMGTWQPSDKIYEQNINGEYFAIYFNKYTGTFICTNNAKIPEGKIYKVVACVEKCTAVDKLKKADECARKYYEFNKQIEAQTQIIPNIATDTEEQYYLNKIKNQSDSIAQLRRRAQTMQSTLDKANIINQEMNKSKLQNYVDTQKRNIEIVADSLINNKNKISVNINSSIDTLNKLITAINTSETILPEKKQEIIKVFTDIQKKSDSGVMTEVEYKAAVAEALSSCPEFDLTGLVKKSVVSDVCYGCDNP
jgi:hypothetical protein